MPKPIYIDGRHNREVLYNADDTHFFVPRDHKGGWAKSIRGKVNWFTDARVQEIEGGYTVEVSLSSNYFIGEGNWLPFGVKGVYGFDVAVDEEGGRQTWRGNEKSDEDTSVFGTIILANEPAVAEHSRDLIGAWQDVAKPKNCMVFEPTRVRVITDGRPAVLPVTYGEGEFTVSAFMAAAEITHRWKRIGDTLTLKIRLPDNKEVEVTCRKLDNLPAAAAEAMDISPLLLPLPKELTADRLAEIQAELSQRVEKDQAVRKDDKPSANMRKVDEDNTAWLRKLVQEVGWIDAKRFGHTAATNAFLLVQHSGDIRLMQAALAKIEAERAETTTDGQDFALLFDRTQLMLGHKQKYGTQIGQNAKGELVVLPLLDRKRVDEFRTQIGLFPLAEYLKMFEKPVGFSDDGPAGK